MDTLIIGAGPAGLTAACFCSGRIRVIDRMKAPGAKLLATGGGRCNLTHATDAQGILSALGPAARFSAPAVRAFQPQAIRAFFGGLGVETVEEADGCVFPASQKATDVLGALLRAARANGADILCGVQARRLCVENGRIVAVETSAGLFKADRVILAVGGRSYPGLGSDGSGFALASEAGLALVPPVPALAGLILEEPWAAELAGIVLDQGGLRLADRPTDAPRLSTGPLLFTHKGVSGPPALALSGEVAARLHTAPGTRVALCMSVRTDRTEEAWRALFETWRQTHGGRTLRNLLSGELPRPVATRLCQLADNLTDTAAARARKSSLQALAARCAALPLHAVGTEGWERAMATRGGVSRDELDPKTLACKNLPGLSCAGEVIDVDGLCGGYNLTWAFASGRLAAANCPTA